MHLFLHVEVLKESHDKILERFQQPKHVGKIENADGIGEVGNIKCGDIMKIFIQVKDCVLYL